jgi:hypothetical protein
MFGQKSELCLANFPLRNEPLERDVRDRCQHSSAGEEHHRPFAPGFHEPSLAVSDQHDELMERLRRILAAIHEREGAQGAHRTLSAWSVTKSQQLTRLDQI